MTSQRMRAETLLKHFGMINYAVPIKRLEFCIPDLFLKNFEIEKFNVREKEVGFVSVVSFIDTHFSFPKSLPYLNLSFAQTNHRMYIKNRKTGKRGVWFFGTTLGSNWVYIPKTLWKMPWHHAKYQLDCSFNSSAQRYEKYRFNIRSSWCEAEIDIEDTGKPVSLLEGFRSLEEMKRILTHPMDGFYQRSDKKIGTYSVLHPEIQPTIGQSKSLYFSFYEQAEILTKEEMKTPHSIFIAPEVEFKINLPPRCLEIS